MRREELLPLEEKEKQHRRNLVQEAAPSPKAGLLSFRDGIISLKQRGGQDASCCSTEMALKRVKKL